MKKFFAFFLVLATIFSLCACGGKTQDESAGENKEPEVKIDTTATEADTSKLEAAYTGLQVHHGQLHDHAKTGRRSDGKRTLDEWKVGMLGVAMEYAALLDHRQTDHMYLEEWDPTLFISGSEAMTHVRGRPEYCNKYHYNMIFPSVKEFEAHLNQFPKIYRFIDGIFEYLDTTPESFTEIINSTLDKGGYFVIPHPLQTDPEQIAIDDPEFNALDYYFVDHIGYEVFYYPGKADHEDSIKNVKNNYFLWTSLLAADKQVYVSAGCDAHDMPTNRALSTVYSDQALDTSYITQLRLGNYTAGPVGVKMVVGDTGMGRTGSFEGQRVVFSVGDFHQDHSDPNHTYRVDLVSDTGVVFSQSVNPAETTYFAIDADPSVKFYRVEVHDENLTYSLLALGNPIWNSAYFAN